MSQFVLETNGSSSTAFPRRGWDPEEMLADFFGRMDGERLFAFLLWRLPEGVSVHEAGQHAPRHFVQCAGSADALTVEVREPTDDPPEHVLSTLGHEPANDEPTGDALVTWRTGSTRVAPHERWAPPDAAALFLHWWRHEGALPDGVVRRERERFPI